MKFTLRRSHQRGVSLVQCLVYIAGLLVIANVATKALFAVIGGTNRNREVAQDIVTAMNAGEQWREDIRLAAGRVELQEGRLVIPLPDGKSVFYEMSGSTLKRGQGDGPQVTSVHSDVAASSFVKETRGDLTVWRWELELLPNGRGGNMKPLFSFLAVEPLKTRAAGILPAGSEPGLTNPFPNNTQRTAGRMPAARGL